MAETRLFLKFFIKRFNRHFAVHPKEFQKAWRRIPEQPDLDGIISLRYQKVVGNDNTVRLGGFLIGLYF